MLATLSLITGLTLGATGPKPLDATRLYRELGSFDRPRVSVWLDRTAPYDRGDRARVYVSAELDAYLTVLRIDTDGRVRVLFPQDPWDDNFVPGGRTFEVEDRDGQRAFRVDDPPGAGFVFAIASDDRFDYSPVLTERDHWNYRTIASGQVRGDPYVAVTEIAEQIVGEAGDYDYDLAQYDVERRYDYPRFVCYDCHAYAPYYTWNPYAYNCVRFRVVIYDDPYYYPYRYYGGRRVVVRPRRLEPRYVFVDNNGGRDYVTRLPNRPRRGTGGDATPGNGGGGEMRPRRGEDVGGRGTIPVPGNGGRRIIRNGEVRTEPRTDQPERRRIEPRREEQPASPETEQRRERSRTGLIERDRPQVQPRPPARREPNSREPQPRRQEPREDQPADRPNVQREPPRDERRDEPRGEPERQAQPERRTEPERRAEPQREPERRAEPRREPERRAEPRRDNGGNRGSSPELRRRPRGS